MDALPAPESTPGLSREDAEAAQQLQVLAQAVVQPWIFAAAVGLVSAVAAALLLLGRAEARAVDTAELVVPVSATALRGAPR